MEENIWDELDELEEDDIYNSETREKELDDDEIEDWQEAWMQGYDEA